MIRIEILFKNSRAPVEIICDEYSVVFNFLSDSSEVVAYKAFNGSAQFLPEFGYDQYPKLVQYWPWEVL